MSTTRTPICAKKKHQELLRNFHPQTSPSKLTFFKNTFYIFIANIAGKILLSSSLNPWDSLPRIELTRKEKREKHTISGLFQFQSSPNFIPWFPFFSNNAAGSNGFARPRHSVIKRHRVLLDFLKELRICPADLQRIRGGICCWGGNCF